MTVEASKAVRTRGPIDAITRRRDWTRLGDRELAA